MRNGKAYYFHHVVEVEVAYAWSKKSRDKSKHELTVQLGCWASSYNVTRSTQWYFIIRILRVKIVFYMR